MMKNKNIFYSKILYNIKFFINFFKLILVSKINKVIKINNRFQSI